MKQKGAGVVCILLLLPLFLHAGITGKIAGYVRDAETGAPLVGANVLVLGTPFGASTDEKGYFVVINIPPGKYDVKASYMGYDAEIVRGVEVHADLTTPVNFALRKTVVKAIEVEVVARRPMVQRDVTSSVRYTSSDEIRALPVRSVDDIIDITAGVVEGHIRGGRAGEQAYMVDGIDVRDPYGGGMAAHIPVLAIQENIVTTGGISAEYGNIQSGVVNVVIREGGSKLTGNLRYRTSHYPEALHTPLLDYAYAERMHRKGYVPERLHMMEAALGGPIGDKLRYFVSGEYYESKGRLPNQDDYRRTYLGKLTYTPRKGLTFKLSGYYMHRNWRYYSHLWKFALDGLPDRRQTIKQITFQQIYAPTEKTVWEFKASYFCRDYESDIIRDSVCGKTDGEFIDPDDWVDLVGMGPFTEQFTDIDTIIVIGPNTIVVGTDTFTNVRISDFAEPGDTFTDVGDFYKPGSVYRLRYDYTTREVTTLKGSYMSQVTKHHLIKAGFEFKYYEIMLYHIDIATLSNRYDEWHSEYPHAGAIYINDKMEYPGMIVNLGFRIDYFNPNFDKYPADPTDPVTDIEHGGEVKNPVRVKPKFNFSPRIGVSHPITERDVLHFAYGYYIQIPPLVNLYRNWNYRLTGAFPIIGNADLPPEKTISYEVGITHGFTPDLSIDLTAFYKDIVGLTTTRAYYYSPVDWYSRYEQGDYGRAQGMELTFKKRPAHDPFMWTVSYTYMKATGRFSSAYDAYYYHWANYRPPTREHYLDWDQRHTLNISFGINIPKDRPLFGVKYLSDMGLSIIANYGSGLPYTPPAIDPYIQPINTKRRPPTYGMEMKIWKGFTIGGKELLIFADIHNPFNWIVPTGIADVRWYEQFKDGEVKIFIPETGDTLTVNINELPDDILERYHWGKYAVEGKYGNPGVWSTGRRVRIGLEIRF